MYTAETSRQTAKRRGWWPSELSFSLRTHTGLVDIDGGVGHAVAAQQLKRLSRVDEFEWPLWTVGDSHHGKLVIHGHGPEALGPQHELLRGWALDDLRTLEAVRACLVGGEDEAQGLPVVQVTVRDVRIHALREAVPGLHLKLVQVVAPALVHVAVVRPGGVAVRGVRRVRTVRRHGGVPVALRTIPVGRRANGQQPGLPPRQTDRPPVVISMALAHAPLQA